MSTPAEDRFFIGWLGALPPALRLFIPLVMVALIAAFAVLGWTLSRAQDDPGTAAFRFDYRAQEVTGVLMSDPYPTVWVTNGTDRVPDNEMLLLAGQGKRGPNLGEAQDGDLVTVRGIVLERGTLNMLQVGRGGLGEGDATQLPALENLGRWQLTGEICDGKCLAGAMRPGTGLAHKACANLCLTGDVPPIFVSSAPLFPDIRDSEYLLVGGPDGGPMAGSLIAEVGKLVTIEGQVHRRGDLLIFNADPNTVETAR
ncbi:MAG: hypothetical protein AAGF71_07560 [Pseudomonadota bacterium]